MRMICTEPPGKSGWYRAYLHPYKRGDIVGYGPTELSAIEDLINGVDELELDAAEEAQEQQRYMTEMGL